MSERILAELSQICENSEEKGYTKQYTNYANAWKMRKNYYMNRKNYSYLLEMRQYEL